MKNLEFAKIVGRLKGIKRTGWVIRGVPDPESVADHSYRTAILAMAYAKEAGVDEARAVKMALIHDLAEAEIGDIVTHKGGRVLPNRTEKLEKEREAMVHILGLSGIDEMDLFDEFLKNETRVANFVHDIDKLEMVLTGVEYKEKYGTQVNEFFQTAEAFMKTKLVRELIQELRRQSRSDS